MENEKKQKSKSSNLLFIVFILILIVGAFFYLKGIVKPKVNVNGTTLTINMTVQELVDAGFAIDDSLVGRGDMDINKQPDMPGEKYSSTFYYLYAPNEHGYYDYANVIFSVFNKDVNSAEFKDCQIYSYRYDPSFQLSDVPVLINDIDFAGVTKEEAIAAIEELGIKFDKDDKEEFMNDERHIIFGHSGDFSYIIETDYTTGDVTNIEVKRDL